MTKVKNIKQLLPQLGLTFSTAIALLSITACSSSFISNTNKPSKLKHEMMLEDFDSEILATSFLTNNAHAFIENNPLKQSKVLKVKYKSREHNSTALEIQPKEPWDWSAYEDFHIAFDIANHGNESVQINLIMHDQSNKAYTRNFVVPAGGETITVYAKMDGHDQFDPPWATKNEYNFATGLRSNPETWTSDDQQVFSLWGPKQLDLSAVSKISFVVQGRLSDREISLDNIRLRPNPEMDTHFVHGLIDRYGQNAKEDYPTKVKSLEDLKAHWAEEDKTLDGNPFRDRSTYGGWKDGPRLKATGNFRTEKVDGKWALVDPEGYLYFSTGIDNVRLSNTSTMTGYDFDPDTLPKRSSDDTLAEDDQPLNRVSTQAQKTRFVSNEQRRDMFQWLPDYDDELGNHYGYRRETQSGPLKHGETYSFYSANLERRYGESTPESYLIDWQKTAVDRMLSWGFTSFGNWIVEPLYHNNRVPFVAFADIIGEFTTLKSGFDFWHGVPDPYDPRFAHRANVAAKTVAKQLKNTPWCMGIFFDNEQSFGRMETDEAHYGIVINTLKEDASEFPAKAAFTSILKKKYQTIEKLNTAWKKNIPSWSAFEKGVDSSLHTDVQIADYSNLLLAYADQYFGTVHKAFKQSLPDYLYLGPRFPTWGKPPEILEAAAKYLDVMTYNLYEEGIVPSYWEFLKDLDKPSLIGEFSAGGADDAGHFHPGVIIAANQEDRARMLKNYTLSVIDNPYFVGYHYFQYLDSPIAGRAYDGENYNNGFVSITDIPYSPMVDAIKSVHKDLYPRRYGNIKHKK